MEEILMDSNVEEEVLAGKSNLNSKGDVTTQKYDFRLYQERYGLQIQGGDSLPPPVTGQALVRGSGVDFEQLDHV